MNEDTATSFFCCPICGQPLWLRQNALVCQSSHSFDLAKRGYVNLLLNSGSADKRHGDDAMMARARTDFLNKGYYNPLADALCERLSALVSAGDRVLDCGCGECFYTQRAINALPLCIFGGIDISKAVINEGAKRKGGVQLAVASAFALPVASGSCAAVINLFAPLAEHEFARVLKPGGALLRVVPTEKHLWELKCAIYDQPYENSPLNPAVEGFELIGSQRLEYRVALESQKDIDALFRMTPYYYKTSQNDQQKLAALESLETQLGFELLVYKKA